MKHVEFFHKDHFENRYLRKKPSSDLSRFIDFFWETDFEPLWDQHAQGFSDTLFPNVGYTYLINLGNPFSMQLDGEMHEIRSDGFLPRNKNIIAHHLPGNKVFGIKFKVSPIVFEKRINFIEYRDYIYPLAYLIDRRVVQGIKNTDSFESRIAIVSDYYDKIIQQYSRSLKYVDIVTAILDNCYNSNDFTISIEKLAESYKISTRTLQRYFEAATSITGKQALQIIRIRQAVSHLISDAPSFHYSAYGYYDYSHFHKHLKQFLGEYTAPVIKPHLHQLNGNASVA